MNIQSLIEKWELEIAKVTPKEDEGGKWYDHEWSNGRYGAISEFLADIKQLNLPPVSKSVCDFCEETYRVQQHNVCERCRKILGD
jgi:hypothetical protein